MDTLLDKKLISTKDASQISGYSSDYLARLARSGKISGMQVGRTWVVDRKSLLHFIEQQDKHKEDLARTLARSRADEYHAKSHAQTTPHITIVSNLDESVADEAMHTSRAPQMHFRVPSFDSIPVIFIHRAVAVFVAVVVVAGSAFASESSAARTIEDRVVSFIAHSAETIAYAERAFSNHRANGAMRIATAPSETYAYGYIAPPTFELSIAVPDYGIQDVLRPTSDVGRSTSYTFREKFGFSSMPTVGEFALSIGTQIRDADFAFVRALVDGSHGILALYSNGVRSWSLAAPEMPHAAMLALYQTGNAASTLAANAPHSLARGYEHAILAWNDGTLRLAHGLIENEIAFGYGLTDVSNASAKLALRPVQAAGTLAYEATLFPGEAKLALDTASHAVQDVALGLAGNTALVATQVAAVLGETPYPTSDVGYGVSPIANQTIFEQTAVTTYRTINGWLASGARTLAQLFGSDDKKLAVVPNAPTLPFGTSTPAFAPVPQPSSSGVRVSGGTAQYITTGVNQSYVDTSISDLRTLMMRNIDASIDSLVRHHVSYVSSVDVSGGSTGFSFSGGPITDEGILKMEGTLSLASGGTGTTTLPVGELLYSGANSYESVATSSVALGLGLTYSGTLGALVGGTAGSLAVATSSLYSGSAGQIPYFSSVNTLVGTSSMFIANNGSIGIGSGTSPVASALLELDSSTQGFLPPRLTSAEKTAIAAPAPGLTVFDTTVSKLNVYNGTTWKNVGATEINGEVTSGVAGSILFVGDGGVLGQDTANFNYSTSTGRLGIGMASPSTSLEVNGTASSSALVVSSLSGLMKANGANVVTAATPGVDYLAPDSLSATYPLQYSSNTFSLLKDATLALNGSHEIGLDLTHENIWSALQQFGNASTTGISSIYASSTNAYFGSLSVDTLSGILSGINGVVSATANGTNGQVLAMNGGIPTWVATTTLATISGTLSPTQGGTGIVSYATGDILYADSANHLKKLTPGSAGQVLKMQAGVPAWGVDATIGGGGSDGIFATSSGKIYPIDTSNVFLLGTDSTTTQNSLFEVNGNSYFSGNVVIGTPSTITYPTAPLTITTDTNSYAQFVLQNLSPGSAASSDLVLTSDKGNDTSYYGDLGINSSTYDNPDYSGFGPGDVYLYSSDSNLDIAAATTTGAINFLTGGTLSTNNRMTISGTGNVGIGTTTPGTILSIGNTGADTINISNTATSTFGHGLNILDGCFAINGNCLTLASLSGLLNLSDHVTGTLAVGNGGTGSTTLTGMLKGNGTSMVQTAIPGTDYELPLTFSYPFSRSVNAISLLKDSTLTLDGSHQLGIDLTHANTWTSLQQFNGNASTTGISSTYASSTNAYFGTITDVGLVGTAGMVYANTSGTLAKVTPVSPITFNGSTGQLSVNLSAGNGLTWDSGTGSYAIDFTRANAWTGAQTFNNGATTTSLSVGSLNGLAAANSGTLYPVSTTTLSVSGPFSGSVLGSLVGGAGNSTLTYWGVATSSAPSANQVPYWTSSRELAGAANLTWDNTNSRLTTTFASTTGITSTYASSTSAYFGTVTDVGLAGTAGLVYANTSGVLTKATPVSPITFNGSTGQLSVNLSAGNGLTWDSGTGSYAIDFTRANAWTGQQTFNTSAPIFGTLTGLMHANGSSAATALADGTAGTVLAMNSGGPAWVATSSSSFSIGGNAATATNVAGTGITGTTLASNVVSSSLTSVGTLSALTVSGQTNLGFASTTGISGAYASSTNAYFGTLTDTGLAGTAGMTYVNTSGTFAKVVPNSTISFNGSTGALGVNLSAGNGLTYDSGTGSFAINFANANTWTALQQFNANASTTQFTSTGSAYLATLGGSVGIGTTSPYTTLAVQSNTGTLSVIGTDGTHVPQFTIGSSNGSVFGANFTDQQSRNFLSYTYSGATNGNTTTLREVSGASSVTATQLNGIQFAVGGLGEKMRIDNSGNVGIGTTAPARKLDVVGDINVSDSIRTSSGNLYLRPNSGNVALYDAVTAYRLSVENGSTESIRLDSNGNSWLNSTTGNVGIGTTNPGANLQVGDGTGSRTVKVYGSYSAGTSNGAIFTATDGTGSGSFGTINPQVGGDTGTHDIAMFSNGSALHLGTLSANDIIFTTDGWNTPRMTIQHSTGNVGIGTTGPSEKLTVLGNIREVVGGDSTGILSYDAVTGGSPIFSFTRQSNNLSISGYDGIGLAPGATGGPSTSYALYAKANGNVGIGTTNPLSILNVATPAANSITWPLTLSNPYLDGTSAGYGVGIKFKQSYDTDTGKWVGISSVAEAGGGYYSNNTGMAFYTSNGSEKLRISSTGNVGIGTTSPLSKLHVEATDNSTVTTYNTGNGSVTSPIYVDNMFTSTTITSPSTVATSNFDILNVNPSSPVASFLENRTAYTYIPSTNSTAISSGILGFQSRVYNFGSGFTGNIYGIDGKAQNTGAGSTVGSLYGISGTAGTANAGNNQYSTTTNAYVFYGNPINSSTNSLISNRYGAYVTATNSGTVTNDYGFYATGVGGGTVTNKYDFYGADAGAYNYFAGNTGIGTTNPLAQLDIQNGTGLNQLHISDSTGVPMFNFTAVAAYGQPLLTTGSGRTLNFSTNGAAPQMTILGNGNVGIGTTNPSKLLSVEKSSAGDDYVLALSTVTGGADLGISLTRAGASGGSIKLVNSTNDYLGFNVGSNAIPAFSTAAQMVLTDQGNVGIGNTAPLVKLQVTHTSTGGSWPTLGTASGELMLAGSTNLWGMFAGVEDGAGGGWLQVMRKDSATAYNLALQPVGGNVGIGTATPISKLQVEGDISLAGGYSSIGNGNYRAIGIPHSAGNWTSGGASIQFWQGGTGGVSNYITFNTHKSGVSAGERMRIDEAGNVGIGTTSPGTSRLTLANNGGGTQTLITGLDTGTGANTAFNLTADANGTGRLNLSFSGTQTIHLAGWSGENSYINAGNVGIGTVSPGTLLTVGSASVTDGNQVTIQDANGTCTLNPGSGATWSCTSDARLKNSIQDATESGIAYADSFRVRDFKMNADGSAHTGVIAQEVLVNHPELVTTLVDGTYAVSQPNNWLMVKALQELDAKIQPLQAILTVEPSVDPQCVTGDTRLRRRKKRTDGSYEYDEVAIADVAAGDEIASLDEASGRVVYARVNALMDMGVQEVFELTTKSGRKIRTTANHPYLARIAQKLA